MDQANVAVDFRSEAARIDLNAAPRQVLAGLFVVLGANPDSAASYADRIIAWRGSRPNDRDPEAFAYNAAGVGYRPRGARFSNANELSLVLTIPSALVERALPFVTVYSGRPQINVLEAAPEVIAALPGMTPDRLNDVLAQRKATPEDGAVLMQLLGPAQAYATTQGARSSRVSVHVAFANGHRAASEVVMLVLEQGHEPYAVLSWHDDLDQAGQSTPLWTAPQ
jgi:general secretion pathway protein K